MRPVLVALVSKGQIQRQPASLLRIEDIIGQEHLTELERLMLEIGLNRRVELAIEQAEVAGRIEHLRALAYNRKRRAALRAQGLPTK